MAPPFKAINVELNLTLRCNLGCTNCNRLCHLYRDRGPEEDMSYEQIVRFVNQIANSPVKVKRLKLLGGEPLVHPDFARIYVLLMAAVGEGLIHKIKIESNGVLPKPDVPPHPAIRWAGKPPRRKRHMPVLWSPRDLGIVTAGPCVMPSRCGISLDAYGYSLCSVCIMMFRVFGAEDLYRDDFPQNWRQDFAQAIDVLCPQCAWSMPQLWCEAHSYPLNATPSIARQSTASWTTALASFDGHAKKVRW